jgi:hypothetical protein
MPRPLRRYLIGRLIYLLLVLIGALVLYWLIPRDVIDAIRSTYFSKNPGEL